MAIKIKKDIKDDVRPAGFRVPKYTNMKWKDSTLQFLRFQRVRVLSSHAKYAGEHGTIYYILESGADNLCYVKLDDESLKAKLNSENSFLGSLADYLKITETQLEAI